MDTAISNVIAMDTATSDDITMDKAISNALPWTHILVMPLP
jgi:hypothetical protein